MGQNVSSQTHSVLPGEELNIPLKLGLALIYVWGHRSFFNSVVLKCHHHYNLSHAMSLLEQSPPPIH